VCGDDGDRRLERMFRWGVDAVFTGYPAEHWRYGTDGRTPATLRPDSLTAT